MIATVIYVLVGILVLTVAYTLITRNKRANDKNYREKSAQITSLSGDASVAITKGDENAALQKYLEIVKLANDIKGTKYETSSKDAIDKAQSKIKEISKLTVVEPGKDYKIDSGVSLLRSADENLFYLKKSDGIFMKKALESNFNILVNNIFSAELISSVGIEDQNKIALLLQDKTIDLVNIENKTIQRQEVSLDGGVKISEFSANLYVLDPGANQIWKLPDNDGSYSSKSSYIKDDTVIGNAVDLAIDGSVYVLNNDCSIEKLSKGSKNLDISINMPGGQKLQNCKTIATAESSESIFVTLENDKKIKIVEIKKDGEFAGQFDLSKSEDTKNIDINAALREVTIQTGSQIFSYKI